MIKISQNRTYISSAMSTRTATVSRKTSETSIEVELNLDWSPSSGLKQEIEVSTGIGFLDHVCMRSPSSHIKNLTHSLFYTFWTFVHNKCLLSGNTQSN